MTKLLITESQFKKLIGENSNGYFTPPTGARYQNKGSVNDMHLTVYHDAQEKAIDNIMKNGFEAFFIGKNVGTAYGRGIYTTLNISSCQASDNHRLYGNLIVKGVLKSIKNFLVLDKNLALKIYGTSNFAYQAKLMLPPDIYERFKMSRYYHMMFSDFGRADHRGKPVLNPDAMRTGPIAISIANSEYAQYFSGYIFHGSNDGFVCFIKDAKSVFPLAYSEDNGKTWKKNPDMLSNVKSELKDSDVYYMIHNVLKKNYKIIDDHLINGFARISNGENKINYIDGKGNLIINGNNWIEQGGPFNEDGFAKIFQDGKPYILRNDKSVWEVNKSARKIERVANDINNLENEINFNNDLPDDW